MTNKKMRKLNRRQLLELMLEQSRKIDDLERQLAEAKQELEDRRIVKEKVGSIAEASLQLNKVFEAAENAASQYLYSIYEKYNGAIPKDTTEQSINDKG